MACIARGIIQIYFTLVEVWTRISIFFSFLLESRYCKTMTPKRRSRLSGKLVGTSMRSKDLAKANGLAVVFDLTAHTFYRLSQDRA